jgi:hypothetical protein
MINVRNIKILFYIDMKMCQMISGINNVIYFFVTLQPSVGHGLLIREVSGPCITAHHNRYDSSGREIRSSQKPLPENAQHSKQPSMPPARFEPTVSLRERPHTHALVRAATGTVPITVRVYLKLLMN